MRIDSVNSFTFNYNQNKQAKPNFQRNWSEHASWGARYIKERGKANFKLFTFPDVKKVFVEVAKKTTSDFGNIWERLIKTVVAPGTALALSSIEPADDQTTVYEMSNQGKGIFEAKNIDAEEGLQYRYIIVKDDNDIRVVKDPYSMQQPSINGWSEIYDSGSYEWKNTDWIEGKDPRRITRKPNERLRGLENLRIEEINIPTLSEEGTFEKAYTHIDRIAERGVANAIEIMPLENTYSLQWGYDGVDKFAVNSKMGTANEFKALIDYAHGKGLNVIIDIVPNHIGPDGNYLSKTGPYIGEVGDFGDIPNFEKPDNRYVRDWVTNSALWWAKEFNADGLRLDMTSRCGSDLFLRQISSEIHEHAPEVFTIAEDARDGRENVTKYSDLNISHKDELKNIDFDIDRIVRRTWKSVPIELGFDSEWDFTLMHSLVDPIVKQYPMNLDDLNHWILNSCHRVKYNMSHDEIGNQDGTRLIPKVVSTELYLYGRVDGADDAEKGQKAAHLSQKLTDLCVARNIHEMSHEEINNYARQHGMSNYSSISAQEIEQAFNIGRAKQKLHFATVFTIPGPKMFFQGDDVLDVARFKFFRELSSDPYDRVNNPNYVRDIVKKKGYDTHESIARPDSLINKVPDLSSPKRQEMERFSKDLVTTVSNSEALTKGDIAKTFIDKHHCVHSHLLKHGNEEILVIKNFGQNFHNNSYGFEWFPEGQWKEIFNSDSKEYGGTGYLNTHRNDISWMNQKLNLAPNSVIILKKV